MPGKKLYLLQLSTARMAEPGTRPAKIVWRKPLDACFVGVLPEDVPDGFLHEFIASGFPVLVYPPKQLPGRAFKAVSGRSGFAPPPDTDRRRC